METMLRGMQWLIALTTAAVLSGCAQEDSLAAILSRGELVVVSRNGPTTYYHEKSGPAGFVYALAGMLARELGVELVVEPAFSLEELFTRLRRREADLAAAGLTLTEQRATTFPHSIPYEQLTTQVVYVAGNFRPRRPEDREGREIVVLADSSHAQARATLRDASQPQLQWREIGAADTM